jgi:transcriptional regulator with XRE-family HTH domain
MKLSSSVQKRRQAGLWLRGLRLKAGLTQLQLAQRLGLKYYPFISQVERGFTRVPTDKMEQWALEVGVDAEQFVRRLISFYEPELHRLLYTGKSRRT